LKVNNLRVNQTALNPIGVEAVMTRAEGLLTCACVIYVSTAESAESGAWVHHANAGYVGIEDIIAALIALKAERNVGSVLVIFAHRGNSDKGYDESIAMMKRVGIPEANIVEIPNLLMPHFGIDNLGFIG
jgi:hypothetical protein